MSNKFAILIYCYCLLITCYAAIWKTEEAYIIDAEEDVDLPAYEEAATESSNSCTDSSGAQGQCVTADECNGYLKFFVDQETQPKQLGILAGMQQYLNGTDSEPCEPASYREDQSNTTSSSFVCCTSLKYANVRSITLAEYNEKYSNETEEPAPTLLPELPPELDSYVVDGNEARPGEFPFAVAIILRGQQICGGSLIDSQWVLSAAHCFDKFTSQSVRQLVLKVGDHNIATTGDVRHQDILAAKLFLHPGFFRTRGYFTDDVALIKLKTPVSPSGNIRSVALHSGSPNLNGAVADATVAGWGKTCGGSYCPQSSVLRKATLSIVSNSQCSQRYQGTQAPPITKNMICAGGRGSKDACNGDSGGPLVISTGSQTYQIGIVSWGIGCGSYPGVYTRVSSFTSWIAKHKQK